MRAELLPLEVFGKEFPEKKMEEVHKIVFDGQGAIFDRLSDEKWVGMTLTNTVRAVQANIAAAEWPLVAIRMLFLVRLVVFAVSESGEGASEYLETLKELLNDKRLNKVPLCKKYWAACIAKIGSTRK